MTLVSNQDLEEECYITLALHYWSNAGTYCTSTVPGTCNVETSDNAGKLVCTIAARRKQP